MSRPTTLSSPWPTPPIVYPLYSLFDRSLASMHCVHDTHAPIILGLVPSKHTIFTSYLVHDLHATASCSMVSLLAFSFGLHILSHGCCVNWSACLFYLVSLRNRGPREGLAKPARWALSWTVGTSAWVLVPNVGRCRPAKAYDRIVHIELVTYDKSNILQPSLGNLRICL